MKAKEWEISLDRFGVTGDLCESMLREAKDTYDANPGSIFSYSVWKACLELHEYFLDPQGIPVDYATQISRVVRDPLKRLIQTGALSMDNQAAHSDLTELLRGLHTLRSQPKNSYGWGSLPSNSNIEDMRPNRKP